MARRVRQSRNRAIGYVRVSTEEQARSGLGLAAQAERVRAYATATGLELVEVVREEGVSGSVPIGERAGGRRASRRPLRRREGGISVAKAKPKPERATVKQTFQVKPELLDAARAAAVADGVTLTEVVNEALEREVKRREKRHGGKLPKAPGRLRPGVRLRV